MRSRIGRSLSMNCRAGRWPGVTALPWLSIGFTTEEPPVNTMKVTPGSVPPVFGPGRRPGRSWHRVVRRPPRSMATGIVPGPGRPGTIPASGLTGVQPIVTLKILSEPAGCFPLRSQLVVDSHSWLLPGTVMTVRSRPYWFT